MQLNNKIFKGLRGIRGFWISLLAIVFGVAFVGLGVYFLAANPTKNYEETTATITSIEHEMIGEDQHDYVIISYTDKNGVEHTGITYDGFDSSWTVGQEIKIKYNVDNPEEVSSPGASILVPVLFIALGGIALVAGVFGVIKTTKILKRKPKEQIEKVASITEGDVQESNLTNAKFFFHLTGKLNQSYAVENVAGETLYECRLKKFSLLAASTYEFIDNRNSNKNRFYP